jgi:acyl-[acyl-carrier-protein] desaturase
LVMDVEGIDNVERNGSNGSDNGQVRKSSWWFIKQIFVFIWSSEHAVEMTTQHLINDGFDIGTGRDP